MKSKITVEVSVNASVEKIWKCWNEPEHIVQWCHASDDWHTQQAENNLEVGGRLRTRMEAKDGSMGFDFEATYSVVEENEKIEYVTSDGRKVDVEFLQEGDTCRVRETFDAEEENSLEMQKSGWQAILENFKSYVEAA